MRTLALTLVVRDESDILATNLDYHFAQGVDVVLAVDHGSSDATAEILSAYEQTGRLRWFQDHARPHDQPSRVNRLLRVAAQEYGADWVIHGDADEFWMPAAGSLRDVFAAIPERYGYIQVARHDFVPSANNGQPFHQGMVIRHRRSLTPRGTALEPKVAQRPSAGGRVVHGNHDLEDPVLDPAPDIGAVEVLHFPMRSFEQFERKVIKVGVGYELLQNRPPSVGCDQLHLLIVYRDGGLHRYYSSEELDAEQVQAGVERGHLVVDSRLQTFMKAPQEAVQESPPLQELLHRAWVLAADTKDALTASQQELRDYQAKAAELERMLLTVWNSRIMRYTAPARRVYYRAVRKRG